MACLTCPDGCGRTINLSLNPTRRSRCSVVGDFWTRPTVQPSVHQINDCGCQFFDKGRPYRLVRRWAPPTVGGSTGFCLLVSTTNSRSSPYGPLCDLHSLSGVDSIWDDIGCINSLHKARRRKIPLRRREFASWQRQKPLKPV
ncbi:DUF6527 family protein [Roseibium polysiphoniae]|uniref:DUF6527 family protein n=1 Tax=Roseibium polysiphoniae TaxID=2571221 RepID=UPI003B8A85D5